MVKVIAIHLRQGEKSSFVSMELLGDIELVQSQNTGRFYATAKRCSIGTTFNEETAKGFIGQSLPGTIGRIKCDPYAYKVPESGETIMLSHTYSYVPPQETMEMADTPFNELDAVQV